MPNSYADVLGYDPFEPQTMIQMCQQIKAPETAILDRYFQRRQTFDTPYVTLDFRRGQRRVAPVGHRSSPGKPVQRINFVNRMYEPPLSNPMTILTWLDSFVRLPGEPLVNSGVSPQERITELLAQDMVELNDMHVRRENKQACDVLVNGVLTLVGDGYLDTIDFQHTLVSDLTVEHPTSLPWTDPDATPMTDIKNWAMDVRRTSGKSPKRIILGADIVDFFLANDQVQKFTNLLTTRIMTVDVKEPEGGLTDIGVYSVPGIGKLTVSTYSEWYQEEYDLETGELLPAPIELPVWPGNVAVLLPDNFDGRLLCATYVDMVKLGAGAPYRYPRVWGEEASNTLNFELDALTIPAPVDVDAWYTATVMDPIAA